jgi:hypothetical protein
MPCVKRLLRSGLAVATPLIPCIYCMLMLTKLVRAVPIGGGGGGECGGDRGVVAVFAAGGGGLKAAGAVSLAAHAGAAQPQPEAKANGRPHTRANDVLPAVAAVAVVLA